MKKKRGFLLVGVLFVFLLLMIIVPVMVKWVQNDSKMSVKDQKSSLSFSLAEAAIDRGYWKVKSSTDTFAQITAGGTITGYNFDTTYTDISGGTYRIKVTSGPDTDQITVYGEGRDSLNKESRAIKAIYTNTSVPGAILAIGGITSGGASIVHWGPIMSRGDITLTDSAIKNGYPRKLAMGTVKPLDPTGDTSSPNTDATNEWWSNYNVPDLPVFDFDSMRSSAAATNTLDCQDVIVTSNVYTYFHTAIHACTGKNCTAGGSDCSCSGSGSSKVCTGSTCVDSGSSCDCVATGGYFNTVTTATTNTNTMQCCHTSASGYPNIDCDYPLGGGHTGCTDCAVSNLYDQTTWYNQVSRRDKDYTWFWDNNASWSGDNGLKGTIVVKGNLSVDGGDYYGSGVKVTVPANAWKEYQHYDTTATNEYPGDLGKSSNSVTYVLGSNAPSTTYHPTWDSSGTYYKGGELWNMPSGTSGLGADLGVYGFLYVKGNFTRTGDSDIYGSMWVEGGVTGSGNTMVFYNSHLKVPTLNVVLTQDSWKETPPSTASWP